MTVLNSITHCAKFQAFQSVEKNGDNTATATELKSEPIVRSDSSKVMESDAVSDAADLVQATSLEEDSTKHAKGATTTKESTEHAEATTSKPEDMVVQVVSIILCLSPFD